MYEIKSCIFDGSCNITERKGKDIIHEVKIANEKRKKKQNAKIRTNHNAQRIQNKI